MEYWKSLLQLNVLIVHVHTENKMNSLIIDYDSKYRKRRKFGGTKV